MRSPTPAEPIAEWRGGAVQVGWNCRKGLETYGERESGEMSCLTLRVGFSSLFAIIFQISRHRVCIICQETQF